ncbi:response regulator [Psychroserpens sp.]|uniref:response regulator n=1 Tax=Psychroserpens sp. TaxID=2020870 RepID=UPI003C796822
MARLFSYSSKIRIILLSFFAVIIHAISSTAAAQNANMVPIKIMEIDSMSYNGEDVLILRDTSRKLTFDDIQKVKFKNKTHDITPQSGFYWYKFKLEPKAYADKFLISTIYSDRATIYAPYKNHYKQIKTGKLARTGRPISYDIFEASNFYFPMDSLDFSKPFYIKKMPISDTGFKNIANNPYFMITNHESLVRLNTAENSLTRYHILYCGILLMSSLLFFISYYLTKDKNFLNYCFYLFFTLLIFAPYIPFIYNILNALDPITVHLTNKTGTLAASGLYLYFFIEILDLKKSKPKFHMFTSALLYLIFVFIVIYLFLLIINPYNNFTVSAFKWFRYLFGVISFGLFVYLAIKRKPNVVYTVVLLGSFLLIAGNIMAIIYGSIFYFLNTVVIEIFIFWGIVNYNYKLNLEKQVSTKFELDNERREKEGLKKLDEAKSNFFTNISHEFRTPLTLINGPIDEQLQRDNLNPTEKRNLNIAKKNSNRLLALINQILDLSKLESGHYQLKVVEKELLDFLKAICASYEYEAKKKKQTFVFESKVPRGLYYIDTDVIEKILSNLIFNALKFSPQGELITVSSEILDDKLNLYVENGGASISKDNLNLIFSRFHRIDENTVGSGVGLALTKELVELHKGTIIAESDHPVTRFTISIPVIRASYNDSEIKSRSQKELYHEITNTSQDIIIPDSIDILEHSSDIEKPILLIVEDNEDLRHYIASLFAKDFDIHTAANGKVGFEKALKLVPDIIITDLMMPEYDGLEMTKNCKVHDATSHIPVVMLTAKAGEEDELIGLEIGADAYISKPFNTNILKAKIYNLLDNQRKLQERFSQEVILSPKDIAVSSYDERFLNNLQTVINDNLVESDFNAEKFAASLHISRMQLHRKLKAITGLSTTEFIRSQRLKLAAELLKKSDINISEVGYSVGFNNHSYFTRCFKAQFGSSPSDYSNS